MGLSSRADAFRCAERRGYIDARRPDGHRSRYAASSRFHQLHRRQQVIGARIDRREARCFGTFRGDAMPGATARCCRGRPDFDCRAVFRARVRHDI